MSPKTAVVNTTDWLAASKEIKLSAFVEDRVLWSTVNARCLEAIFSPRESLAEELEAWDRLSDEALINFEKAID